MAKTAPGAPLDSASGGGAGGQNGPQGRPGRACCGAKGCAQSGESMLGKPATHILRPSLLMALFLGFPNTLELYFLNCECQYVFLEQVPFQ